MSILIAMVETMLIKEAEAQYVAHSDEIKQQVIDSMSSLANSIKVWIDGKVLPEKSADNQQVS